MQAKKLLYVLLAGLLTLTGCTSSSAPRVAKKPKVTPKWVTSPLPSDTNTLLYGLGIARDRESAINAALSNMLSKLGTTIESSYESNQEVKNSYSSFEAKNNIKSSISQIKVNNYEIVDSFKISYKEFAVMIKTDKQKFAHGLKEELATKRKEIQQVQDSLKKANKLVKYNSKRQVSKKAQELLPTIYIIAQIDNSFDKESNINFVLKQQNDFLKESKKLKFFVSGNKKSSKFVEKVKNYLSQKNFNIVSSAKDAVLVKIDASDNLSRSNPITTINLNISILDKNYRIGGKSLTIKERYSNSINKVYTTAAIHFEEDLKNSNINETIGLNLDI